MYDRLRLLIGGPMNSGKSTFALSLVEWLRRQGISAISVELDVWSNSYAAFRGECGFDGRPKMKGEAPMDDSHPIHSRLHQFHTAEASLVLGDLPGRLTVQIEWVLTLARADGAIIVSRISDGMNEWRQAFLRNGFAIFSECLTAEQRLQRPFLLSEMNRVIQPENHGVRMFGQHLAELLCGRRR